ncbi:virulence factor [Herbaspirillum sp. DW155]|uniref:hypothetical protein n=1 Tax=Herbaspirillum sp. DW155 TaxID=3095609 RepID=UPI00308AD84E|nr:virulence factor [Herbaspirillum sp. DW155]
MNRLILLPLSIAVLVVLIATAVIHRSSRAIEVNEVSFVGIEGSFRVQVVGIQWLNPLMRRDYPTEWELLWALGVTKPNKNDDEVKRDPATFTSIQPIAPLSFNVGNETVFDDGRSIFPEYLSDYLREIVKPIGRQYAMNRHYFYTIQPEDRKRWRELHGIRVELAIPDIPLLTSDDAAERTRKAFADEFEFHNPELSTANIPADVNIVRGSASAGFTSLSAGMDYLKAHPERTVWVMNMDAPEFPEYGRISENCTLLILAGPKFDTGREPLAWISRPAVRQVEDFATTDGESRIASAWKSAIQSAAEQASISPYDIRYVIHDAGKGSEEAGRRLGVLAQAMTQSLPELDVLKQTFNTSQLLGDMRAGTAITNVALAIAWAHHKGKPVMVAGTTETDKAIAVVITPPERARVFDPEKSWFRARGEGYAYLPWWGLRKDLDWKTYMQGYSD